MNKKIIYFIAIFQAMVLSLYASDGYNFSYNDVSDKHKMHIEECIKSIFPGQFITGSVKPLLGGLSGDDLYLIATDTSKYIFRCMKQPHSADIYQKDCMYVRMAAEKGLGPKILYQNAETGCYATEFVEGEHLSPTHFEDVVVLEQFTNSLKFLHNTPMDLLLEFDIFARLEQKIESRIQKKSEFAAELQAYLGELHTIKMAIKKHVIGLKTCHNDVHVMNLFYTPEKTIQFIDWGNAGLADPFWDLACAAVKFHFSPDQTRLLLEKYFEGVVSPQDYSHFILMENTALLSVGLDFLGQVGDELDPGVKSAVLNYLDKAGEGINHSIDTFEDAAAIAFNLFQKRTQSQEYAQALMLLEQL